MATIKASVLLLGCAALTAFLVNGRGDESNEVIAVSSRVNPGYVRVRQSDGAFAPETYVFAQGGLLSGQKAGGTESKLNFLQVAGIIAKPLAVQNYVPGRSLDATKLLISVYWGTTIAPEYEQDASSLNNLETANMRYMARPKTMGITSPAAVWNAMVVGPTHDSGASDEGMTAAMQMQQAENEQRDQTDARNAALLGYDSWWHQTARYEGTPFPFRSDMLAELEQDRYFVVLLAYDFSQFRLHQRKLLWETRYSVAARGHEFDQELAAMTRYASRYFGKDSNGLVHRDVPTGHVDLGELRTLSYVRDGAP